jgi:ribosomal protein S18 acetylase RimI-like enzyme
MDGGTAAIAERRAIAGLLADAFEADPMQQWLFPDDRRRPRRLRRFYELDLEHRLEGRCTVERSGSDGVAFWHPPGDGATVPVRAALRLAPAFLSVAAHHPVAAVRVLAAVTAARPEEPHWYLSHLAVAPQAQGRGVGGRLLRAGLAGAEADGVGVYLETANPANLPFYGRHGLTQVGTVEVGSAPPVWLLWRPAP